MVPELSTYMCAANNSLTWNSVWISELESVWSIIEKIKLTNYAEKSDIFDLFGLAEKRKQKTIQGSKNHDLYLLAAFDENLFREMLGFSLKTYNKDLLHQLSGFLSNSKFDVLKRGVEDSHFWRKSLTFCLVCMKDGYHSILHQLALIHQCPFHGELLYESCPNCLTKIPYELSDRYFEAPYVCLCGYQFRKIHVNITHAARWRKYSRNDIQDNLVKRWINLNDFEQDELSRIYLYRHIDFKHTPQMLAFLLSVIHSENNNFHTTELYQVTSPKNIFQIKSHNSNDSSLKLPFEKISPIQSAFHVNVKNNNFKRIFINELNEVRYQTIHSLGKHFRKTILKDHKTCIRRYVTVARQANMPDPPICPFAYAYVKWKQALLSINYYYDVDNKIYNPDPPNIYNLTLTTDSDWDPLFQLINVSLNNFPIHNPECYTHVKWVVSHMVGYISLYYFYEWLSHATGQKTFLNFYKEPFVLRGKILAFRFPENKNQPLQVIWDQKQNIELNQIQCPFPTQKLRRKKIGEVSHHPMRIAMEKIKLLDRTYLQKDTIIQK
ncbi:hypothetical protein Elgi_59150 [Paenibacillus elgii]|uniref:hypothetical protein n=1 Tax=Paenibacillus elgii TaxID=189691 RepID=UPI002D7C1D96|nr:hypothetical protein Elgi_59150 [Paenibacillus elgii]